MSHVTEQHSPAGQSAARPNINAIRVLSSGSAEQRREHRYGTRWPRLWWVLTSRSWVPLPLNYFLIEHKDGPILFDTGLDPRIATAELTVSETEWSYLSGPHPEHEWILREHIELPDAKWRPFSYQPSDDPLFEGFEGIHDVAGDGSMILLPTPGHTNGSLSMLIRREGWAEILLVGDLTYEADLLEKDQVPGTGDAAELRRSYAKVRSLGERLPELVIVPSHDFVAEANIARATGLPA